jgi:ABC-type lipoprotein export system ATPase subunit
MLQLIDITKSYKTASLEQQVLKGVSLSLRENEFVAILGQSGSGKTTLLNIIGGLDRYDDGELIINGISTKRYSSRDWDSYRNHSVGFVFQSYNLIPHQTLLSNVELALTIGGISKAERVEKAKKALEQVGLAEHMYKKPSQISGGQMQRVAIARALVNDPDILLADEPTGALDSDTSLQVMDLLKEVAKDRLVVMVTHNPDLAEQYATRIVRLKDGIIEDDTDPFEPGATGEAAVHRSMGRSSMSFLTALVLSFNNLWTKKARTLLVALAGSIGIIGIALIMSLSNGVNKYVADIEAEALQNYPLTITDTSFSPMLLLAMSGSSNEDLGLAEEEEDPDAAVQSEAPDSEEPSEVRELPMMSSFFAQMVTNDLASLMAYFESGESDIYDHVQTIEYDYNIAPQIFLELESGPRQVNPDQTFSALGFSSGGTTNGLWSAFSSTDSFIPLPKETALYEQGYDVKAGRWPQQYTECVVVLSSRGYIADICLYTMGLKDPKELDSMMQAFADGTSQEVSVSDASYLYDDFLGRTFKVVPAADLYTYDEEYEVWVSHTNDTRYLETLLADADELKIVGVVQPKEDNPAPIINMGIGYPASLISHLIDSASDSEIVLAQKRTPEINVLTGVPFGEEKDRGDMDLTALFSQVFESLGDAFQFDTGNLNFDLSDMDLSDFDFSDLDLSGVDFSDVDLSDVDFSDIDLSGLESGEILLGDLMPQLTEEQVQKLLESVDFDISQARLRKLVTRLLDGYMEYAEESPYTNYRELAGTLRTYLGSADARKALAGELRTIWDENKEDFITYDDVTAIFRDLLAGYEAYREQAGQPEPEEPPYPLLTEYLQTEEARAVTQAYADALKQKYRDSLADEGQLRTMMTNMLDAYEAYALEHKMPMPSLLLESFGDYLQTQEGRQNLMALVNALVDSAQLRADLESMFEDASGNFAETMGEALQPVMESAMQKIMEKIGESLQDSLEQVFSGVTEQIGKNLANGLAQAFRFDSSALESAIASAMDVDELSNLMMSMFYQEDNSYESNLRKFGYADYKRPSTITIYPKDFDAKGKVKEILDEYNDKQREAGADDKVIAYTDAVDVLIGSVTDIVNVVSYVLIAFVSISLVVSSVMIGVITYISVLERRKEIGILRAIGASKRNISQVFNAETFITGALAGILGIGITLASIPPINHLIHNLTDQTNINAHLPLSSAGLLILLSIVLTLIGGIIPSMKAAKSDPVAALRSE